MERVISSCFRQDLLTVKQVENPLQCRHCPLHDRVFRGKITDRRKELFDVLDERHQRAEGKNSAEDFAGAVPDKETDRNR